MFYSITKYLLFCLKVTSVVVSGLKPSEVYYMQVHAVSSAGVGEPAIIEILTPLILPCGSDKDPGNHNNHIHKSEFRSLSLNLLNFLNRIKPSFFGTIHYHFRDVKMRTLSSKSVDPAGHAAWINVNYKTLFLRLHMNTIIVSTR